MAAKSKKQGSAGSKNAQRILDGMNEAAAIMRGEADPKTYRVHYAIEVDVEKIRKKLKLTQAQFAFSLWVLDRGDP